MIHYAIAGYIQHTSREVHPTPYMSFGIYKGESQRSGMAHIHADNLQKEMGRKKLPTAAEAAVESGHRGDRVTSHRSDRLLGAHPKAKAAI